jgi:hypothetical protein
MSAIIFIHLLIYLVIEVWTRSWVATCTKNQQLASCAKPKTKITPFKPITKFQICGKKKHKKGKKKKPPSP